MNSILWDNTIKIKNEEKYIHKYISKFDNTAIIFKRDQCWLLVESNPRPVVAPEKNVFYFKLFIVDIYFILCLYVSIYLILLDYTCLLYTSRCV